MAFYAITLLRIFKIAFNLLSLHTYDTEFDKKLISASGDTYRSRGKLCPLPSHTH